MRSSGPDAVSSAPIGALTRLSRLVPAAWFGALLCIAALVAPTAFGFLPRATAGALMGRVFAVEAALSCGLALLALMLHRRQVTRAAEARGELAPSFTPELLLIAGVLFCTVAGYYGLLPAMQQARLAGPGAAGLSAGTLHGLSMAFYAVKLVLVGALAWRAQPGVSVSPAARATPSRG